MFKKRENNKTGTIRTRYRLTIFNDETLLEVSNFVLTKLNIFAYLGFFIILISIITSLLFVYTPLSRLLPTRSVTESNRKVIENAVMIDSLQRKLTADAFYLNKIKSILDGKAETDTFDKVENFMKDSSLTMSDLDVSPSTLDSVLRAEIEVEEGNNLSVIDNVTTSTGFKNLHFFMPVKGMITDGFDMQTGHYAIDIAAGADEPILATLGGTVILATWSTETGYVIELQHANNLISIYKHNSVLLKKTGDRIEAGETIAIIGNTGELTTGPHLHFELWHNGVPLDPQDFIAF